MAPACIQHLVSAQTIQCLRVVSNNATDEQVVHGKTKTQPLHGHYCYRHQTGERQERVCLQYQPAEGSPAEGEAGHEQANGGDHGLGSRRIDAGSAGCVGGELRPGVDVVAGKAACDDLHGQHERACNVEEWLATKPALPQTE